MRGQVLGVDTRTGEGLVAGDDGNRYRFTPEDWAQRGEPAIGIKVDFESEGDRALSVFPLPEGAGVRQVVAPPPPRTATRSSPRCSRSSSGRSASTASIWGVPGRGSSC
jgi:hypothetical protein